MKIENVVVISLSDYKEYQELKKKSLKKEIDFSRLNVGSKVIIDKRNENYYCSQDIGLFDFSKTFSVLILGGCNSLFNQDYEPRKRVGYNDITFIQNGKTLVYNFDKIDKILTEVIEY